MRLTLLLWILGGCYFSALAQQVQVQNFDEGSGPSAQIGDRVAVSYTLRLASGDIIEATPAEGGFRFTLGGSETIPGMTAAVVGMKRGGSRRAIIPPELAYGDQGAGAIPPRATLYFDIRLDYLVTDLEDGPVAKNPLAKKFGKDGDQNRPDARHLDKPAMFEYLIRDFFTRPWRYDDSPRLISQASAVLSALTLLLWWLPTLISRGRARAR